MPKHAGLEAYILCEGVRLEEYDVQTSGNVITCWIESRLEKCSSVVIDNPYADRGVESQLYIDGARAATGFIRESHKLGHNGVLVDERTLRPFKFCALKLTDDDNYLDNGSRADKLGTIELELSFAIDTGSRVPYVPNWNVGFGREPVHERSKKLAPHRVGLSEEAVTFESRLTRIQLERFDKSNPGAAMSVCFKYRPRALLEAWGFAKPIRQLHAPKPPPAPERVPQSQEKKRRIESNKDDSEDEKVRNLEAELERLKQNRKKRRVDVKKEQKESSVGVPRMELVILDDGVIDLTRD